MVRFEPGVVVITTGDQFAPAFGFKGRHVLAAIDAASQV